MSKEPKSGWLESGERPHYPYRQSMHVLGAVNHLLYAAWAYGMEPGEEIHRYALFCFVQTHLSNAGVEALQQVMQNDKENWTKSQSIKGFFKLTTKGHRESLKLGHGQQLEKTHRDIRFVLERKYKNHVYSIRAEPFTERTQKLYPIRDGKEVFGTAVWKELKGLDAERNYNEDSPDGLLSWIIEKKEDFSWRIE